MIRSIFLLLAISTGGLYGQSTTVRALTTGDGKIDFVQDGRLLLSYQYRAATLPPGVDTIYSRGGFVHPLRSPAGDTLTLIHPPDHYHHYGLWNPWTHTEHGGRERDFWNLAKGDGTVVAAGLPTVTESGDGAELIAHHAYLAFPDSAVRTGADTVLLEELRLRVTPDTTPDRYLLDYLSVQTNPTELPFTVKAYRYQGLTFRGRAGWGDSTATFSTSAGHGQATANATRARWMKVEGPTPTGTAGVLLMAHPGNFNAPQSVRVWPTGTNGGRDNIFLNFNPAQDRDWRLRPGGSYHLRYRLLIYNGHLDTLAAARYWDAFAANFPGPPLVEDSPLRGKRILVYTRNGEGYVHDNIAASVAAIEQIGRERGCEVVSTDDASVMTAARLSGYDLVVFSNTNNDVFETSEQHAAFKSYIEDGGAFVGIHSACGSERDWPWFARTIGGRFLRHPPRQDFDVVVLDGDHPSTDFLPPTWHQRDEECYYLRQLNPAMHVLLAADLATVADPKGDGYPGDTFGDRFPTAWTLTDGGGGRRWYTSLGHHGERYRDPLFLRHLAGGMEWAVGGAAR